MQLRPGEKGKEARPRDLSNPKGHRTGDTNEIMTLLSEKVMLVQIGMLVS